MICQRFGRRLLVGLSVPVAVWLAIVAFMPTGWARTRLVERLERSTGKVVRIEALRLGLCGGVHLRNVLISEPDQPGSPWLTAARVRVNASPLHVICGRCEPTRLVVDGLGLRVHRMSDGQMEFGNLLAPRASSDQPASPPYREPAAARDLEIEVRSGRVEVVDDPTATQLELTAVSCAATWQPGAVAVQRLFAHVNGGTLELAAQVDRSAGPPLFEGQIRAQNVSLAGGMGAVAYLLPMVAESPDAVEGRLTLNVYLRGQRNDRQSFARALVGHGSATIDPLQLDNTKLVADLCTQLGLAPRTHLGSVRSEFTIGQGRIKSEHLTLALGPVPLVLTGWTDFEGKLDYRMRQDGVLSKLPQEARALMSELDVSLEDRVDIHLSGTLADLTVRVDGLGLGDDASAPIARQATGHFRAPQGPARRKGRVLR